MGEVVNLADFRGMRVARALERHFGLPRGAAVVHDDPWAERHSCKPRANPHSPMNVAPLIRPGRDAGSIGDPIAAIPADQIGNSIEFGPDGATTINGGVREYWPYERTELIAFAKTGAPPENPRQS